MSIYRDRLASISKKAADEVQQYMMDHGFDITEEFLDYTEAIVTKYGEAAGALSAQFYDDIAEYWTEVEAKRSRRAIKAAEAAEVPTKAEIRKTVYGTLKESAEKIPGALSRLVKRTAEDTTLKNAIRDGAEFAWVPAGDTCAFCIMLASRGWQRASKAALKGGHAEHIHANCDCTYTIRFNRKGGVEGYDPDRYLKMYENANGGTWQQRVNDMRREQYAADPEKYRAQKRAAYERNRRIQYGSRSDAETGKGTITVRRVDKYGYNNIYVDENVALTERQLRNVNGQVSEAKQLLGISDQCDVQIVVTEDDDRLAAYNPHTNVLVISSKMTSDNEIRRLQEGFACPEDTRSTMVHELLHWKDAEEYRRAGNEIFTSDFKSEYVQYRCEIGKTKLIESGVDIDNIDDIMEISDYSVEKWFDNDYDEVYTEFRTRQILER